MEPRFKFCLLLPELQRMVIREYIHDYGLDIQIHGAKMRTLPSPFSITSKAVLAMFIELETIFANKQIKPRCHNLFFLSLQNIKYDQLRTLLPVNDIQSCTMNFQIDNVNGSAVICSVNAMGVMKLVKHLPNLETLRINIHGPSNQPNASPWLQLASTVEGAVAQSSFMRNFARREGHLPHQIHAYAEHYVHLTKVVVCVRANAKTDFGQHGRVYLSHKQRISTSNQGLEEWHSCIAEGTHQTSEQLSRRSLYSNFPLYGQFNPSPARVWPQEWVTSEKSVVHEKDPRFEW